MAHVGGRVAGGEAPHQALVSTAQLGVVVPAQHGLEQGVLCGPAGRFELDMLTALQERPGSAPGSRLLLAA